MSENQVYVEPETMTALLKTEGWFTPQEYLDLEREAEEKHEFLDGYIVSMDGGSIEHNTITSNFQGELRNALKGSSCRSMNSDTKVRIEKANLFRYPDVSAFCGPIELFENHNDAYKNPQLIVEVLSKSTEDYDRRDKFLLYRMIESFTEYVLVSQNRAEVEVHRKQADGSWVTEIVTNPAGSVKLVSMQCEIEMAEIYENIEFDADI